MTVSASASASSSSSQRPLINHHEASTTANGMSLAASTSANGTNDATTASSSSRTNGNMVFTTNGGGEDDDDDGDDDDDSSFDFYFHGTGCSSALPLATCLARADHLEAVTCRSCREAALALYDTRTPEQRARSGIVVDPLWARNARGNIGGVIRKRDPRRPDEVNTLLIDVGKTFREQSIRLFPRWGVKRIDAVILTHAHADAIAGLDDLRTWCPRGGGSIPVYLSRETLAGVRQQFPYLVDASKATGGGHVSRLEWRVFDDDDDRDQDQGDHGGDDQADGDGPAAFFPIPGLKCLPLRLHHGQHFGPQGRPYVCWGFLFDRKVAYFSDLNYVPKGTWKRLNEALLQGDEEDGSVDETSGNDGDNDDQVQRPEAVDLETLPADPAPTGSSTAAVIAAAPPAFPATKTTTALNGGSNDRRSVVDTSLVDSSSSPLSRRRPCRLPLLVIDCLRLTPYASHLGFFEALHIASLLGASRTYLVGFADGITHAEWTAACQEIDNASSGADAARVEEAFVNKVKHDATVMGWEQEWDEWTKHWKGFVRPAWDGLQLKVRGGRCEEVEFEN